MLRNHIPQRRCIGCMVSKNQNELIRMTVSEGCIKVDDKGNANGRGFYICSSQDCLDKAIKKKSFNRVIRGLVREKDLDNLRTIVLKKDENY